MSEVRCPVCNTPNDENQEICQVCGARLRVKTEPLPPIKAGDEPTPKSTSDLERTLPGWLRDLRNGEEEDGSAESLPDDTQQEAPISATGDAGGDDLLSFLSEESQDQETDLLAGLTSSSDEEPESSADFLAGLSSVSGADEDEAPDWLKDIQASTPELQAASQPQSGEVPSSEAQSSASDDASAWFDDGQQSGDQGSDFFEEESQPAPPAEETSEDVADWLRTLDSGNGTEESTPVTPAPTASTMPESDGAPDWLADLGGESIPLEGVSAEQSDDLSNWFESVPEQTTPVEDQPASSDGGDWFADFADQDQTIVGAGAPPTPGAGDQSQPAETPDWLSSLGQDDTGDGLEGFIFPEESQPEVAPEQPSSAETPDWLASLGEESEVGSTSEESFDFSGLTTGDDANAYQPATEDTSGTLPSGEMPDWLSDLGGGTNETPAEAPVSDGLGGDTLSWLSDAEPGGESIPEQAAASADSEMPNWLNDLGGDTSETSAEAPVSEELGGDALSWLSDAEVSSEPVAESLESETPGWLGDMGGATEEAPSEAVPSFDFASDTLPGQPATKEPPTEPLPEGMFDSGDLPSWLSDVSAPGTAPSETELAGETPDWLAGMSGLDQPVAVPAEESFGIFDSGSDTDSAEQSEELLTIEPADESLLPDASSMPAFVDDSSAFEQESEAITMGEMPDWLSGIAPTQDAIAEPNAEIALAGGDDLTPGDLPSWVQAMRPVETVVSDDADGIDSSVVEKEGPLAGLRNVLPSVSGGLSFRKPQVYSNKLELDDSQQAGSALLESLITAETTPRPISSEKQMISAYALRLGIFLALLIAVVVPFILDMQFAPSNTLLPPEALAAANQLTNMAPDSKALIVFDYEAGLSGEMEAAAVPVIEHLMVQGVDLAFVSTSPVGPLLAERMLSLYHAEYQYHSGEQYVNLGYLPGGPAGIAAFVSDPVNTIEVSVGGDRAWETPALTGLSQVSDFSVMIVITDSVDTGRSWVEQSIHGLGQTPLLMVISAQVEPMMRPYYDAGQIKGLVTGLVGGAAYEQITGNIGLGRAYWDSFSSSFAVAELFILIGGLLSFFTALRASREQQIDEALQ